MFMSSSFVPVLNPEPGKKFSHGYPPENYSITKRHRQVSRWVMIYNNKPGEGRRERCRKHRDDCVFLL